MIHKLPHLKLTCAVLEFGTSTLGLSMAPPFTEVAWPTPCQHKNTLTMNSVTLQDPKQPHHASVSATEQDAGSVEHRSALKYNKCFLAIFLSLSAFHFLMINISSGNRNEKTDKRQMKRKQTQRWRKTKWCTIKRKVHFPHRGAVANAGPRRTLFSTQTYTHTNTWDPHPPSRDAENTQKVT